MQTMSKRNRKLAFINPRAGSDISHVITEMIDRANMHNIRVTCVFNEAQFVIDPGMTSEEGYELWNAEMQRLSKVYRKTMKAEIYRRKQEASVKADKERGVEIRAMLSEEKIQLAWLKRIRFNKTVSLNSDPYSAAAVHYALAWAVSMQRAMRAGKALEDVAEELSYYVNYDGITGAQHGFARAFLISFWKYGKELEAWHQSK